MAGGKKYPDLRYLFMRGLIKHEADQRLHHYLKSAAECTSRAIVSLELADTPVKSVKQARQLEGIGGETSSKLTKLDREKEYSCLKPLGGRFVSSAGGILVGLLDGTEVIQHKDNCSPDKTVLVPEDSVKLRAIRLTEEQFANGPNEFCKAWWRLEVLIKKGYVRRRSQKKSPVLQLMPIGKEIALRLRAQIGLMSTVPDTNQVPNPYCYVERLTSNSSLREANQHQTLPGEITLRQQKPELEDALYTNDYGQECVVMLVDRREMGGEKYGLGELCSMLDNKGICYKTQHLQTGDYSWIWRVNNKEIILPCLAERKRADDIVRTLLEGRFWSQVNKMKEWKQNYTEKGIDCAIHYILERKPEEYVVKCEDGCQGIVKCGNPSLTQVKMVIEDLKKHPDLLVKETDSLNITVILLASLTAELKERVKKGDFDKLLHVDNSEKKSQLSKTETLVTKDVPVDNVLHIPSADKVKILTSNTLSADISYEDKMKLAIEMSKADCIVIDDDDDEDVHDHDVRINDAVVVDEDGDDNFDAELALVLERSKYDTHMEKGVPDCDKGGATPETRPLMQYHCSEGGSLNFPSGKSKENPANMYRPKINRRQVVSTVGSPQQDGVDTSVSQTMNHLPCNEKSLSFTKSSKECASFMESPENSRVSEMKEVNSKPAKRKQGKKELVFQPDESCVEESNVSDSLFSPKKKPRVSEFNFTPSRDCIEINMLQTSVSSNLKNKGNRKKGRRNPSKKFGKVSKNVKDETFLSTNESKLCDSLDLEHKNESKEQDENQSRERLESTEKDRYNSDEDIFADTDDDTYDKSTSSLQEDQTSERETSEIHAENAEHFNLNGDVSLSKRSGSEESLPDIDNDIPTPNIDISSKSIKNITQNWSQIGNKCSASCSTSSKRKSNDTDSRNSGRMLKCFGDVSPLDRLDLGYDTDTPNFCDREFENKVDLVISVLPHVSKDTVREMLRRNDNNVDVCVTKLLEENGEI